MSSQSEITRASSLRFSLLLVNITYWLAWLGVAALLVTLGVSFFGDPSEVFVKLPIKVEFHDPGPIELLSVGAESNQSLVHGFSDPSLPLNKLSGSSVLLLLPLLMFFAALWLLTMLRRFLRNVRDGRPFDPANPRLLHRIGLLAALTGPALGLVQLVVGYLYINLFDFPGAVISINADFHWGMVLTGVVILVIARVYETAVAMKTDADLTI